jgi:hypothetical protein
MIPYIILSLFSGLIMVRPHNARRPLYRELRQNANPADPENPNNHPPTNPNVVHVVYPSANANLNASQSEAALHQHQPPRSATRSRSRRTRKPASLTTTITAVHMTLSLFTLVLTLSLADLSLTLFLPFPLPRPHPLGGQPRRFTHWWACSSPSQLDILLQSNYVQGRIAKANAAKAALDKAGTAQGPSQDKACATPFKAKIVCATPGTSILVTRKVPWPSLP